jgi:hypothetical protein
MDCYHLRVRLAPLLLLAACGRELDQLDGIFYDGEPRLVHCAANLDDSAGLGLSEIDRALDRARDRSEIVELYAHQPGDTVAFATLEHVLAGAVARGLPFVTYGELSTASGAGIALSFDDAGVASWIEARPMLAMYGARVTFFVTRYHAIEQVRRDQIGELATDGHEIAAHSAEHVDAPRYVDEHGLAAYLAEQAVPSIERLVADGHVVTSYAYPFGARTGELDDALAAHVGVIRSVAFPVGGVASPCPR